MTKQVSFIAPLFNHLDESQVMLYSLLESLPAGLVFEVILVDDFSTDDTRSWLAGLNDPRIKVILNEKNMGFAKTNNAGVAIAHGEYLCLVNNDLVFEPGWFEPMFDAIRNSLNAGIVGNLQFRVLDGALDHAGVLLTARGKFDHDRHEPQTDSEKPIKVLAATGACLMIRKDDYLAVGGFDEAYVNGCEDYDLCFKMRRAGKAIYIAPQSRIKHHVSLSRSRSSVQNERNSQYLYAKWRKEIKFELTRLWVEMLQSGQPSYEPYIYGQLLPGVMATPQTAARTIAEAMLLREEARWARELGSASVNGDWIGRVRIKGLRHIPQARASLPDREVELVVDSLSTARNFYVCGRRTDEYATKRVAVTLTANNIQEQTFVLGDDRNINVGLIDPILIPEMSNRLKMAVHFVDEQGQKLGSANEAMLLTHFVVDDQRVDLK